MQMPPITVRDLGFARKRSRQTVPRFMVVMPVRMGPSMIFHVSMKKLIPVV
jgi:hypothetical protein